MFAIVAVGAIAISLPYLLMLVVLLIRPWGLLGRPEAGH
jgi:branched-subunit amino acid ABC-type transport system permease component